MGAGLILLQVREVITSVLASWKCIEGSVVLPVLLLVRIQLQVGIQEVLLIVQIQSYLACVPLRSSSLVLAHQSAHLQILILLLHAGVQEVHSTGSHPFEGLLLLRLDGQLIVVDYLGPAVLPQELAGLHLC